MCRPFRTCSVHTAAEYIFSPTLTHAQNSRGKARSFCAYNIPPSCCCWPVAKPKGQLQRCASKIGPHQPPLCVCCAPTCPWWSGLVMGGGGGQKQPKTKPSWGRLGSYQIRPQLLKRRKMTSRTTTLSPFWLVRSLMDVCLGARSPDRA